MMEKSEELDKRTDVEMSNGSKDNEEEEKRAKELLKTPYKSCHNINDLKVLDLNSADEMRQVMKSILNEKSPLNNATDGLHVSSNKETNNENVDALPRRIDIVTIDCIGQHCTTHSKHASFLHNKDKVVRRNIHRRAGRPPKPGSTNVMKKRKKDSIYIGKLSNLCSRKPPRKQNRRRK